MSRMVVLRLATSPLGIGFGGGGLREILTRHREEFYGFFFPLFLG